MCALRPSLSVNARVHSGHLLTVVAVDVDSGFDSDSGGAAAAARSDRFCGDRAARSLRMC